MEIKSRVYLYGGLMRYYINQNGFGFEVFLKRSFNGRQIPETKNEIELQKE